MFLSWWRHQMEAFSALLAFVRRIHRSSVNSPHKGQWRGALMFSVICVWINGWVNNREAGDLRRYRAHYDVTVMSSLRVDICNFEVSVEDANSYHGFLDKMRYIKGGMFVFIPIRQLHQITHNCESQQTKPFIVGRNTLKPWYRWLSARL